MVDVVPSYKLKCSFSIWIRIQHLNKYYRVMIDIEGQLTKFSISLRGGVHFGAKPLLDI
jgi:hypothetical protein